MRSIYSPPNVPLKIKVQDIVDPGVIIRVSKFNEEGSLKFCEQMTKAHQSPQKTIPIIVDSFGGSVYDLLTMVAEIENAEKPIATIVLGKAMSCGAILFSCGDEGLRFMAPKATLMIHEVSSVLYGKNNNIQITAKEINRLNKQIFNLMSTNCGHESGYFLDILHKKKTNADWYLTAKQAKRHNLANEIHVPKMKVSIHVNYDFS